MSINNEDIRKDILKLVRKSASTFYDPESLLDSGEYSEYRIKFLECRKQFEQPPPPVYKKPFFPYWIKPECDADLPITYKKRGTQITDIRINFLNKDDRSNGEIGDQRKSDESGTAGHTAALQNQDSIHNEKPKRRGRLHSHNLNVHFARNREEVNSPGSILVSYYLDKNLLRTSDKMAKRLMDRERESVRLIRRSQSARINEERSPSMPYKSMATSECDKIVVTPVKNPNTLASCSTPPKPIVCRPIVTRLIELKKYDHIITNIISSKK